MRARLVLATGLVLLSSVTPSHAGPVCTAGLDLTARCPTAVDNGFDVPIHARRGLFAVGNDAVAIGVNGTGSALSVVRYRLPTLGRRYVRGISLGGVIDVRASAISQDGGRLVAVGGRAVSGRTQWFAAGVDSGTGRLAWQRTPSDLASSGSARDVALDPVRAYVAVDGDSPDSTSVGSGGVIALDVRSGAVAWTWRPRLSAGTTLHPRALAVRGSLLVVVGSERGADGGRRARVDVMTTAGRPLRTLLHPAWGSANELVAVAIAPDGSRAAAVGSVDGQFGLGRSAALVVLPTQGSGPARWAADDGLDSGAAYGDLKWHGNRILVAGTASLQPVRGDMASGAGIDAIAGTAQLVAYDDAAKLLWRVADTSPSARIGETSSIEVDARRQTAYLGGSAGTASGHVLVRTGVYEFTYYGVREAQVQAVDLSTRQIRWTGRHTVDGHSGLTHEGVSGLLPWHGGVLASAWASIPGGSVQRTTREIGLILRYDG